MADIDIEIEKKSKTDINATVQFETYGEVIEINSEENLYTSGTQTNIELNPECIEIEISGLKNIDAFIGLTDTPLYYENGKFFKVQDNKIVYTDITWLDIQGEISENPNLESQIKEIAKQYSEQFVKYTVDNAVSVHNEDTESHKFIQDIITNNYDSINTKIDVNINNLTDSIELLEAEVTQNEDNINTLFGEQAKTQENIITLIQDLQNNNILIQNTREDLKELDNKTKSNINDLNNKLIQSVDKINNNTNDIERNYLLISDIVNDLKDYVKKNSLAKISFSGDFNDLINTPDIPSLDGYATINYVDQRVDNAIGQISGFDFLVVDKLPDIGESGHIYLVPHKHGDKDIYDEYIWVQYTRDFEKIGTTDLDLSDYYTKSETNKNLDKKVDKIDGYSLVLNSEIERLSNVDNYNDTEIKNLINTKQDKLTAGENISIIKNEENKLIISATDTVYTAGEGINIEGNVITNTNISAEWGNVSGDINSQTDLQDLLSSKIDTDIFNQEISKKQDILTVGDGIDISNNTISGTTIVFRDWSV